MERDGWHPAAAVWKPRSRVAAPRPCAHRRSRLTAHCDEGGRAVLISIPERTRRDVGGFLHALWGARNYPAQARIRKQRRARRDSCRGRWTCRAAFGRIRAMRRLRGLPCGNTRFRLQSTVPGIGEKPACGESGDDARRRAWRRRRRISDGNPRSRPDIGDQHGGDSSRTFTGAGAIRNRDRHRAQVRVRQPGNADDQVSGIPATTCTQSNPRTKRTDDHCVGMPPRMGDALRHETRNQRVEVRRSTHCRRPHCRRRCAGSVGLLAQRNGSHRCSGLLLSFSRQRRDDS